MVRSGDLEVSRGALTRSSRVEALGRGAVGWGFSNRHGTEAFKRMFGEKLGGEALKERFQAEVQRQKLATMQLEVPRILCAPSLAASTQETPRWTSSDPVPLPPPPPPLYDPLRPPFRPLRPQRHRRLVTRAGTSRDAPDAILLLLRE